MHYFDASALVKRYVREKGSAKVRRLLSSDAPATSRLSELEVASALQRLTREGAVSRTDRDRALAALDTDLPSIVVVELTGELCARARVLLQQHPLRAGDAIQLASCLYLQEQLGEQIPMVAFDDRLVAATRLEGLRVTA
ncbi:MAG TPA: type II toxin-antitoxin system VapC family toxin [Vicinamibacterales bacterium]|nr:type II toxin-antitoxin system VapC family toxin [Vicinamibacterales bacterium]